MFSFILLYLRNIVNLLIAANHKLDAIINSLTNAKPDVADKLSFDFIQNGKITERGTTMIMEITDSQQDTATLTPLTASGKPAPVEPNSALWTGPTFVALNPSADGLSCTVVAMGIGGDVEGGPAEEFINCSVDADLGVGVKTISGRFGIHVTPGQAVSLGFSFGTPTEQVAAGPAPNPVP